MSKYIQKSNTSNNHIVEPSVETLPYFFAFEGVDCAGKTTLMDKVAEQLVEEGYTVWDTREPGGTALAEKLRDHMLYTSADKLTKLLMVCAGRQDHVENVIKPYTENKVIVLSSRFTLSTHAYQATGLGQEEHRRYTTLVRDLEAHWPNPNYIYVDISEKLWCERVTELTVRDELETDKVEVYNERRTAYLRGINNRYGGLILTAKEETNYDKKKSDTVAFIKSNL